MLHRYEFVAGIYHSGRHRYNVPIPETSGSDFAKPDIFLIWQKLQP